MIARYGGGENLIKRNRSIKSQQWALTLDGGGAGGVVAVELARLGINSPVGAGTTHGGGDGRDSDLERVDDVPVIGAQLAEKREKREMLIPKAEFACTARNEQTWLSRTCWAFLVNCPL